ncbi:MAG: Crp/Fnr family transcriptional regulator [Cytophagales bacterium]|nr:MAG: Crp/Fnr family transcriptional regulator [Cytophagales bacterium]
MSVSIPKGFTAPNCETCPVRHKDIFSNLEKQYLSEISERKNCNLYKKGSIIFYENNQPLGLYAIFNGKVKVFKTSESGKEQILRLVREGDVLGYRSLISGEPYEVSAMAIEDTRVCFIPKGLFLSTLQQSGNLSQKLIEMLSQDLKLAEDRITQMAQKTVKERVAETILMLKGYYGIEEDNQTIKVSLSREDLANLVGTATETLIRSLSEFKSHKVIDIQGKKIIILNNKLLEEIANNFD